MTNLTLVKIGGGVITDKHKRYGLREEVLTRLAKEIADVYREDKNARLIIGNGAGSYAHWSAKKYRTAEGYVNGKSKVGAGWVHHDAVKLNQIVVEALLKEGVPAYSFAPSSMMSVDGGKARKVFTESLKDALVQELVPVVYGDVVIDGKRGSGIFSTEKVFSTLIGAMNGDFENMRVIHVSREDGVLVDRKVVGEINKDNFGKMRKMINGSKGVDVTGGMTHKVEESLKLAEQGIESVIVNGLVKERVKEALKGEKVVGTKIR